MIPFILPKLPCFRYENKVFSRFFFIVVRSTFDTGKQRFKTLSVTRPQIAIRNSERAPCIFVYIYLQVQESGVTQTSPRALRRKHSASG